VSVATLLQVLHHEIARGHAFGRPCLFHRLLSSGKVKLSTHGTDLLHPLCAGHFASDGSTLSGPFHTCLQQQILPRVAQASARALQLATAAAGPETAAAAATALAMGASAAAQSAAARASAAQAALGGAAALMARLQVCRLTQ